jgi:O-methyltransferase
MSIRRIPPIRRFFQLQIPQAVRPTITSVLAATLGRVNLEGPAAGLTAVAYWVRFSRWCKTHPVPGANRRRQENGRNWLYRSVIEQQALDASPLRYLEFGVYRGDSLRLWLDGISNPDSQFVGFDTFTGLPERWRPTEPAGHFNAYGVIPDIKDQRCSFEVGLFQDSLPAFVARTDLSVRLVINLDADMFTSTLFVLATLAPHFKSDDLIFFDEFSCPLDEFRAFEAFARSFRVDYEIIGAVYGYTRVCIRIV